MARPDKIIVHLGLQKTGTTSIQLTMAENRALLEKHAAIVVRQDKRTRPLTEICYRIHARTGAGTPDAQDREALREGFADLVTEKAQDGKPLLISDELFPGRLFGTSDDWSFFPALPEICTILTSAVPGVQTHFVLYTRSFHKWIASAHNQAVKVSRLRLNLEEFRSKVGGPEKVIDMIDRLTARIGSENLTVVPMEDELAEGQRLGQSMYRMIGLTDTDIAALKEADYTNPSLTPEGLALMLKLNRSKLQTEEFRKFRRLIWSVPEMFR